MPLVQIVGKDFETLILGKREPFQASLRIPAGYITSFVEAPFSLIDAACFIRSFEICIPFGMELVIHIGDEGQILGILSGHRKSASALPLKGRDTLLAVYAFT